MALQGEYEFNGVTIPGAYIKITSSEIDALRKICKVTYSVYASKQVREENPHKFITAERVFILNQKRTVPNPNYDSSKPETNEQGEVVNPKTILSDKTAFEEFVIDAQTIQGLYNYLKTLPKFEGFEDV